MARWVSALANDYSFFYDQGHSAGRDIWGMHRLMQAVFPNWCKEPDGVRIAILKPLATIPSGPISSLSQASRRQGKLPMDLKLVDVMTIYKGGQHKQVTNYRPAITSVSFASFFRKLKKHLITRWNTHFVLSAARIYQRYLLEFLMR